MKIDDQVSISRNPRDIRFVNFKLIFLALMYIDECHLTTFLLLPRYTVTSACG